MLGGMDEKKGAVLCIHIRSSKKIFTRASVQSVLEPSAGTVRLKWGGLYSHLGKGYPGTYRVLELIEEE